jgi:hypothetical protein
MMASQPMVYKFLFGLDYLSETIAQPVFPAIQNGKGTPLVRFLALVSDP